MSQTIYASYTDSDEAERLVGSLLELGAIPEDISLIAALPAGAVDKMVMDYAPALMMVDAGQARLIELRYGQRRVEKEGSAIYESEIGGGISTSQPEDDVSAPEELDDSEFAAEDLSQPVSGKSFGSAEFQDADAFAQLGTIDPLGRHIRRHLMRFPAMPDISSIAMPGILILGDGLLALRVLETDLVLPDLSPVSILVSSLVDVGVPLEHATRLAGGMAKGGAVIAVTETVGILPLAALEALIERSNAENLSIFETDAAFTP